MNHFDQIHQYHENLLRVQYQVSEIIDDELTRGTLREEFIKEMVLKKKRSLKINKGIVSNGSKQSNPCDLIFCDSNLAIDEIGGQMIIEPKKCKMVLEVKSNATGKDFKKTNRNFGLIKSLDSRNAPRCGLFCYNTVLLKKSVLNRFGYSYDKELESWGKNTGLILLYPDIDFIICIGSLDLDEDCIDKQFFLIKDEVAGRFILTTDYPIIKNFFAITDNL